MIQRCSIIRVLEVFFVEPTTIHFIREIGNKINLAPTSVRNHVNELLKMKLIVKKKSKPFDGYIANKDDKTFLFDKGLYNLYTLQELRDQIVEIIHPKAIVVFGSYLLGEDIETSDIDILIISKVKSELDLKKFEKKLKRSINVLIVDKLSKLDKNIQKKIINGFVIYGALNGDF
ncbi:MAG: nucleotidyltransferase domain-containing protein [Bacteroidota bacterium]